MAKLTWDADGTRTFETGVDHGVLYVATDEGGYGRGVAWCGLTAVTESPSGAEPNKQYADNIVYVNLTSAEEFGGTIEAFSSPEVRRLRRSRFSCGRCEHRSAAAQDLLPCVPHQGR